MEQAENIIFSIFPPFCQPVKAKQASSETYYRLNVYIRYWRSEEAKASICFDYYRLRSVHNKQREALQSLEKNFVREEKITSQQMFRFLRRKKIETSNGPEEFNTKSMCLVGMVRIGCQSVKTRNVEMNFQIFWVERKAFRNELLADICLSFQMKAF